MGGTRKRLHLNRAEKGSGQAILGHNSNLKKLPKGHRAKSSHPKDLVSPLLRCPAFIHPAPTNATVQTKMPVTMDLYVTQTIFNS